MQDGVIKTVEKPLFVKGKHELQALLKKIQRGSAEAVDMLIETMNNTEVEVKTRVACAQSLIEYEVKITDQINKDQLTRQVAEVRAKGLIGNGSTVDGEDKPLPPRVDFTQIQEV